MYFEFIPHVQGRPDLSHMHKRCVTHLQRCLFIGETWISLYTQCVEVFFFSLDGDGAVFLVLHLCGVFFMGRLGVV